MKNKCESCRKSKSRTFNVVFLFIFEDNKAHLALEMNLTNLQYGGKASSHQRQMGGEAEVIFIPKITHF